MGCRQADNWRRRTTERGGGSDQEIRVFPTFLHAKSDIHFVNKQEKYYILILTQS